MPDVRRTHELWDARQEIAAADRPSLLRDCMIRTVRRLRRRQLTGRYARRKGQA